MSEPCTDKWHGTDKCPTCGMEDTGYDRGFRDGAARVAPSDGLREAALTVLTAWARTESPDWGKRFAAALDALRDALATTEQPEPTDPDPTETFSHPYRAPVVIDGHEYRHTSECDWPARLRATVEGT
jgi:hypothetical protein